MKPTMHIAAAVLATLAHLGSAQAAEDLQTMKPMQGLSFHAGTTHVSSYFLSDNANCNLVLTMAEEANYTPTRFETTIESGKSTRYQLAEGTLLVFACQANGQEISVRSLKTTASN